MQRNIVTAFLAVAGGHVFGTIVSVVTVPILVRILGPTQYGEYATLFAIFGFVMILPKAGTHDGLRKYLAEERRLTDWRDSVFGFYFRLATLLTLLVAGAFLLLPATPLVELVLDAKYEQYLPLLAVWALVNQYSDYLRKSLMGLKLEHVSEPIKLLQKVSFGVGAITLSYVGYGITGVIAGHILAGVLVVVASGVVVRDYVSFDSIRRRVSSNFPARELVYFNGLTVVFILLLRSLAHVDILMLEHFTSSSTVGYYKAALVLVEFLWFVPLSIQWTMLQSTSDLWRQGRSDRIETLAARITRYTVLFTTLLAVGLVALAPVVVPLYYGEAFRPSVLPLLLLVPGTVGFAVARPILAISQASGRMRMVILATGIAASVNFGLNLVLIPIYGMAGAAVATTLGYGSLPVVHVLGARRLGYDPFSDIRWKRVLATVVLGGGLIFATTAIVPSTPLSLVVVPPVGFLLYSILAIKTGAIDRSEVIEIVDRLPEPLRSTAMTIESLI